MIDRGPTYREKGITLGHYIANVRDIEFNLFEVLGLGTLLDAGAYGDLDAEFFPEFAHQPLGVALPVGDLATR